MGAPKKKYPMFLLVLLWFAATGGAGYLFWQTLSGAGSGDYTIAELERSRGIVSFRNGDSILWKTTQVSQKFNAGDVISTNNSSSATIETTDGHVIELDANTMIRLELDSRKRTAANGDYELRLLKGTVVARSQATSKGKFSGRKNTDGKKLLIASGKNVVALSEKPDAVVGLKTEPAQAEPEVFLSLGKNTLTSVQASGKKEVAVIPVVKAPDLNIKPGEPVLAALKGPGTTPLKKSSSKGVPSPVSPDAKALPSLSVPVKPKFEMPKLGISPELLAKLSGSLAESAGSEPPSVKVPATGMPVVKKSVKFTPLKKLGSQKLETKMPPVVVPKYPLPVVKLAKKTILVTTQKLKDGCSLASFIVNTEVKLAPNTAPDWVPFVRIAYEGGDYREIADVSLPAESGKHATTIDTGKICGVVGGKGGVGTITLTPGYQKEDGKIFLRRTAEKAVMVLSLHDRTTPLNISFIPLAKGPGKKSGWLPFVPGKTGADSGQIYVTKSISKPILDKLLGNSMITAISEAKTPAQAPGVFFVKNNEIVLGASGGAATGLDARKMTKKLRASFGFTGEASNFVGLNGPPINRLAKLETLAQQTDTVTLIVRQRSFEMKASDMQEGQTELLHMAASLAGAFKKKPAQIIFPQAVAH